MIVDTSPVRKASARKQAGTTSIPASTSRPPLRPMVAPTMWRQVFVAAMLAGVGIAILLAWRTVDHFLIRDPRFTLAPPTDPAIAGPGLRIEGMHHAPHGRILAAFESDYGRSIYLMPLTERRRDLLGVNWVRSASLSRVWPNQIHVRIEERKPAAYARLARGMALIDEEGVFLERPETAGFTLPILEGVTPQMPEPDRHLRVSRALRLLAEAGARRDEISEIDVTDASNLKITQPLGTGQAVLLILGHENFQSRLENFHAHADEIRTQCPGARVLDLRSSSIIIARADVHESGAEGAASACVER